MAERLGEVCLYLNAVFRPDGLGVKSPQKL